MNSDGASDDDYSGPAAEIRNLGVDVFAVGVGKAKKEYAIFFCIDTKMPS